MKYIPNVLTIIRFVFIPLIVTNIAMNNFILALIFFSISSFTDVLDGIIARKFNAISDLGKLLDPLADKLTQLSILLTLTLKSIIPFWIVIVLIIKELILIIGASFLYGRQFVVSSKWYGKFTTVILYISVVSSLLINIFNLYKFDIYIYSLAIFFAIYSLFAYIIYFYGKGYLPNKEELKKSVEIKQ